MSTQIKIGDYFGGYKILALCGSGAYGKVYLAENTIGEKLIIKVVENTSNSDRELNGIRNYMKICKENSRLLQIYHVGNTDDGFYYTMEVADNLATESSYQPCTLGNLMREGKVFSLEEVIKIIRDILQDLKIIHAAGLIHRDIKPDNIIFINGKAKLSDPGLIARQDSLLTIVGTPGFIPPEVLIHNHPIDFTCDLYALGKVFYCMISGNKPEEYPHLSKDIPLEVRRQIFPVLSRMCNSNPSKRFSSADEFLAKLPEKFRTANLYERALKSFWNWKTLNREKYRFLLGCILVIFLAVILSIIALVWQQKVQKEKLLLFEEKTNNFLKINDKRWNLLDFQLENTFPTSYANYQALRTKLNDFVKTKSWEKSAKTVDKLAPMLSLYAEQTLPKIPEKNTDFEKDFALIGKARGFILSPLFVHLPKSKQENFIARLNAFEDVHYRGWKGPRCEGEWSNFENQFYSMVFLPPGKVKMDHNKKTLSIPYYFWMMKNEVSSVYFTRMLGIAPQKTTIAKAPVERVLWNDVLFFCYVLTQILNEKQQLPPGYIVRPPTESEWEYAAKNAYLYNEELPWDKIAVYKDNSPKSTQPSGTKQATKLGLNDIYGNVREIVLNEEPTQMQHSIVIRGGSFRTSIKDFYKRVEVLKYQNIPYDIGFRAVIAPGDMSYFDKHFFLGGPTTLRSHGRVFELIGENLGCFDWKISDKVCRLLGGKLAELDTPELVKEVIDKMPLAASSWGCFLGGKKTGDKWHWISSNKEIKYGDMGLSKNQKGDFLTLKSKRWKPETSYYSGVFLCQWDEKEFSNIKKQLTSGKKLPFELERFSIGNRNFILFNCNMGWYTTQRVCELLGGRLACLDTPQLQKAVITKLEKYSKYRIFLGGYAKRNNWYWLSGKKLPSPSIEDKDMTIPTINKNFITLKNKEFHNSQFCELFLLEWQGSKDSSN